MLAKMLCRSLSWTACCWGGGVSGGAGGAGAAVAGRGVAADDAEEAALGPGDDCTLLGL